MRMRIDHLFIRHFRAVFTLALLSGLAGYCALQAQQIDELQQVIAIQQANVEPLLCKRTSTACSHLASPCPAKLNPGPALRKETIDFRSLIVNDGADEPSDLASTNGSDSQDENDTALKRASATTLEREGELTSAEVRELFNTVLGESVSLLYSDADLVRDGAELLKAQIANETIEIDSSLAAAYALNDLTSTPVPEHLSQALLQRATKSLNEDDLHETLIFIAEQRYPHTRQLATELINSTDESARMVGAYLLVTDQEPDQAVPELLNHLYTYPEETMALLGQWARE